MRNTECKKGQPLARGLPSNASRGAWTLVAVVALLVSFARPALAYEDSPEANAARRAYSDGADLYREGKYSEALARFQAGYALRPDPVFLFNIAQCYRRLGQSQKAISTYEAYLEQPNIVNRQQIEALLVEERAKLGLPAKPTAGSEPASAGGRPRAATDDANAPSTPDSVARNRLWLGLGVSGVVVGAIAVGIGGYALSQDGKPSCNEPPPRQCREVTNTLPGGVTAVGVGGAAMIAGAVSLYFALRHPQRVAVLPTYFASGGGLVATGRF